MTAVRVEFDGQPIAGMACSADHAEQLREAWESGDRFRAPIGEAFAAVAAARRAHRAATAPDDSPAATAARRLALRIAA